MCHFSGHQPYRSILWEWGVDEVTSSRHAWLYLTIVPLQTENNLTVYLTQSERTAYTDSSLLWSHLLEISVIWCIADLPTTGTRSHRSAWNLAADRRALPGWCPLHRIAIMCHKERQRLRLKIYSLSSKYELICLGEGVQILYDGFFWLTNIRIIISICFMWK